jgi:hypothetical protein
MDTIKKKVVVVFLSALKKIPGWNPFLTATAFLQAMNNSPLINHELIATDVAFGVSHRVAAVKGRVGSCKLSMW